MKLSRWLPLSVLAAAAAGFAAPAAAQSRTFAAPTHGGLPVDYCAAGGSVCGADVAASWCRAQGYEFASEWAATRGVDATSATIRLDDGAVCRGRQCEAFASITCGKEPRTFRMPKVGPAERATLIAPSRRLAETAVESFAYEVLIPGCHQREPGVFLCATVHEYQHCRTLLGTGKAFGCRAGLAFDGDFAEPIAARDDDYTLTVNSTAVVSVKQGQRGAGNAKGDARFEVSFAVPSVGESSWCLQRDRYVYHPTGPKGGLGEIDDTGDCAKPITGAIEPHEDHVLQAYDLCEAFAAWGSELEQPIDLLVGALFHMGSANPQFRSRHGSSSAIVAPYVTISAPMRVRCE